MALFRETADVSVRPAVAGDEGAVTDVQVASWEATGVLGEGVIEALDVPAMRERWASAITSPPGPGFGVLVALDGPKVVGVAAVSPGQVLSLEVLPGSQRGGHGRGPPCPGLGLTRGLPLRLLPGLEPGITAGRRRSRPGASVL